jgi:hypothetical protein
MKIHTRVSTVRGRLLELPVALKFIVRKLLPFSLAITYATFGFHFRKVAEKIGESRKFDDNVCTE